MTAAPGPRPHRGRGSDSPRAVEQATTLGWKRQRMVPCLERA